MKVPKEVVMHHLSSHTIFLNLNQPEDNPENTDNDDILSEHESFDSEETTSEGFAKHTLEELYNMLEEAVQNEDYEKAAKIRDEIDKKES